MAVDEFKSDLKQIQKDIYETKIDIAEIKTDLRHHIKRTELLEGEVRQNRQDLKPVREHVNFIKNLGRLTTWVVGIGGLVAAYLALK